MTAVNAKVARDKLSLLISEVASTHEPVVIQGDQDVAVLVGHEDWRAIQETLHLLSVPGMRESLIEGTRTPPEQCAKDLDW